MQFFDSHAHLSSSEMLLQMEEIAHRAQLANVSRMINICTDPQTLRDGLALQKKFPFIQNTGATTPHDAEKEGEDVFEIFAQAARDKQIVAIGETGLEYFYKELNRSAQKKLLVKYLHLAQECKLPVIFHCREAFEDLFTITDAEYQKNLPAILHCFTGTVKEAEEVLSRGWYVSFSGIVTFKKSEQLRQIAKMVPLNQLLIETDAPYLAPQSKRGKQNEPSFLPEIAQCIASVKEVAVEEVADASFQNAAQLFQ